MNVLKLNEYLSGDNEKIIAVLEALGFEDIRVHGSGDKQYLSFANLDGDNKGACNIYVNSLKYLNYTRARKGNIYTLVMDIKHKSFPSALDWVSKVLKLNKEELSADIILPFGGFYKKIIKEIQEPEFSMKTYDETILDDYTNQYSSLFFEDGICYSSQEKYGVGYDIWSNRITIPEYTLDGKLCGIMGRLNNKECEHEERWLPLVPCSRNLTLFGYTSNYNKIQEKDICVILESEKAIMQLDSFNCHIGLATCGYDISNVQARYIKGLNAKHLIVGYDEGLEEEYIREQAKKLIINNPVYKNKVGYIYDRHNDLLKKGSKKSPSDIGKKGFSELIKNNVVWI